MGSSGIKRYFFFLLFHFFFFIYLFFFVFRTFDAISKGVQREGIRSLYSGFGVVSLATIPAHALYFGGYENTKRYLSNGRKDEEIPSWVHFSAGFVADICGALLWTPMVGFISYPC